MDFFGTRGWERGELGTELGLLLDCVFLHLVEEGVALLDCYEELD
jgi:hypothetical protein